MSDDAPDVRLEPYPSDSDVYRAIPYRRWLLPDNSGVTPEAFYCPPKFTKGLSVIPRPEYWSRSFSKIFGLLTLNVGEIRGIAREDKDPMQYLDVVPDETWHGNIINVPFYPDTDLILLKEANRLAELLANLANHRGVMSVP